MATKQAGDGCHAKALPHEEMFVLLARDAWAPETIRYWCDVRIGSGKNLHTDPEIVEALDCADRMEMQRDVIRSVLAQR